MEHTKTHVEQTAHTLDAGVETTIQRSLEFARATARDEIESIDRLHKRTLTALGIQLAAFGLLFSFVGWIGYSNLKRVAVQTATDVVKERLADELTQKNIDTAVQQALQEHATEQIADSVRAQVSAAVAQEMAKQAPQLRALTSAMTTKAVASIQPQIEAFAKAQAQGLISEIEKPRQLDASSRFALTKCAKVSGPLNFGLAVGGDPEAQNYEAQISQALRAGGWKVDETALLGSRLDLPRYGLAMVTTPKSEHSSDVGHFLSCFREAKMPVQLVVSSTPADWETDTALVVLQKTR
jgi:hypothetical protein